MSNSKLVQGYFFKGCFFLSNSEALLRGGLGGGDVCPLSKF